MMITKLPEREFQIGIKEIVKGVKAKQIDFVVLADNTPEKIFVLTQCISWKNSILLIY